MSETSCESVNLSECKSVAELEGEREDAVVNLRRAINIVAYLLMSVGMIWNFFYTFSGILLKKIWPINIVFYLLISVCMTDNFFCLQRNLSTLFPTDLSSILFVLFLPNFCFQRNCINDVILDKICILQGIQYCDFAFCCNSCVTFKNSILRGYWTWLQLYQAKWIYRGEGSSSKSDDVIYGWPLILLILFGRSEFL